MIRHRYYGENVLHMSCVAEDPSVVKWLLDIGADIDRYRRALDGLRGERSIHKVLNPLMSNGFLSIDKDKS